jgi:hypothetical protein
MMRGMRVEDILGYVFSFLLGFIWAFMGWKHAVAFLIIGILVIFIFEIYIKDWARHG